MGSEAELHTLIEQDEEGNVSGPQLESPTTETVNDGRIAIITDLTVLAIEVSGLLDTMKVVMEEQRNRRLEKLKGLPLARRNWYMAAIGGPMTTASTLPD